MIPASGVRFLKKRNRKGAATVEAAVVLPVFLLLVCAIFELGHVYFVYHSMQVGCRSAARLGTLLESGNDDIIGAVQIALEPVGHSDRFQIDVRDGSAFDDGSDCPETGSEVAQLNTIEVDSLGSGKSFVVHSQVAYRDIALLPVPTFLPAINNLHLHAYTVSRRE